MSFPARGSLVGVSFLFLVGCGATLAEKPEPRSLDLSVLKGISDLGPEALEELKTIVPTLFANTRIQGQFNAHLDSNAELKDLDVLARIRDFDCNLATQALEQIDADPEMDISEGVRNFLVQLSEHDGALVKMPMSEDGDLVLTVECAG